MSDQTPFGFGKFIPGFDFLQNLTKAGQSAAGSSPLSHWVAPTVSVEEISKRIEELKAVQFWLEQNSRALAATVQALEVQKMTLSTLKGMNVSMADLAKSFTGAAAPASPSPQPSASHADWPMSSATVSENKKNVASNVDAEIESAPLKAQAAAQTQADSASASAAPADAPEGTAAAGLGDPMLWWGALSQQFQQIAAQALQDPAQQQAVAQATHMASDFTKAAMNAASSMVRQASEGVKAASSAAQSAASVAPSSRSRAASGKAKETSASASSRTEAKAAPKAAPKASTSKQAVTKTARSATPAKAAKTIKPAATTRSRSR